MKGETGRTFSNKFLFFCLLPHVTVSRTTRRCSEGLFLGHEERSASPSSAVSSEFSYFSSFSLVLSVLYINSVTLAVSFLSFLTAVWGSGQAFTWLISLTGIRKLAISSSPCFPVLLYPFYCIRCSTSL